ncbi:hypothetical protein PUMCH_000065 [Australozyma saopauloensis]|uniref:Protein transport protein SEC23 n=1 Tax=Australozyma saopauloensis TaxID=291208 RepID=A0AAX4H2S8_9ASCO|nr:hypothetical protein PUMCH_000065 [[Candida] saopauloensis]
MSRTEFNWDVFPSTKLEARQMSGPIACLFTPFESTTTGHLESNPIQCSNCQAILNQFIRIDRENRLWWCPLCQIKSELPERFVIPEKGCSDDEIPLSIRPSPHGTVDYVLPEDITESVFSGSWVIFVIDVYQYTNGDENGDDFWSLKTAIAESIDKLENDVKVAIITFSEEVYVHFPNKAQCMVLEPFQQTGDFMMDFSRWSEGNHEVLSRNNHAFSAPSEHLKQYIMSLQPHPTKLVKPCRRTGTSLLTVCELVKEHYKSFSLGRVFLFQSGPPTTEPGKVSEENTPLRTHNDIVTLSAPHLSSAIQFYSFISLVSVGYTFNQAYKSVYHSSTHTAMHRQSSSPKFTFNIFVGSSDQTGVYEMKRLAEGGNGTIYMTSTFCSKQFVEAFHNCIVRTNNEKKNCSITVLPSIGIKIISAIGNCTELESSYKAKYADLHHDRISDLVTSFESSIKLRNFTNQWYLGGLNNTETTAFYFDVDTVSSSSMLDPFKGSKELYVQFQTRHFDRKLNRQLLRVTTVRRPTTLAILDSNKVQLSNGKYKLIHHKSTIIKEKILLESFNANIWITLLTRLLVNKIDYPGCYNPTEDITKELDKILIRLLSNFGGIEIDREVGSNPYDASNYKYAMHKCFEELPSLAYQLRKNQQLTKVFNCSPDETASCHNVFKALCVEDSEKMIRPRLYKVVANSFTQVPFHWNSLLVSNNESHYVVLDSVTTIIICKCTANKEDSLPLHPSYNDDVLYDTRMPQDLQDVIALVRKETLAAQGVFPRIIVTQTGHSQERSLKARLEKAAPTLEPKPKTKKWWQFSNAGEKTRTLAEEMTMKEYLEILLSKVKAHKNRSI